MCFNCECNLHYEKFADGSVKCIEDEIPFEIPKSWAWCRFSTITINRDSERKPVALSNRNNAKKTYDYYGASGKIDKIDNYIFNEKLLLIGEDGANLITRSKPIAFFADGKYWVNNHAHCIDSTEKNILEYICLYINSISLEKYVTGAAQPKMNQKNMNNILIPLPPFNEQTNIFKKVSELNSIIDSFNNLNTNLFDSIKSLKSKILDLAIRGKLVPQDPNDESADVLLERIRKEKEELIKQGKIKRDKKESIIFKGDDNSYYEQFEKNTEKINDEIPFNIPDSWKWTRLGSYAQKITDYVASGSFASLRENVPVLKKKDYAIMVKTADFSNNFTQNLTYTTEQGYNYLENSNLFGGELILSNIGSIGKVFIVPKLEQKMTLAPNTVMVKLMQDKYRDYVYNFLLSPLGYSQLLKISGGTGIAKFNKTDLKTLLLPIPPLNEQIRIIQQIESLFDLLSKIEYSIK